MDAPVGETFACKRVSVEQRDHHGVMIMRADEDDARLSDMFATVL